MPAEVAEQPLAIETAHAAPRAQNRASQRVPAPIGLRKNLVHQVIRRVFHHLDFFLDDAAFVRDVRGLEERILHQVGEDAEGPGQVLIQNLDGIVGGFLGGEGVQVAANGVRRARNLLRAAVLGSLKEHVLDKVRDAVVLDALLARAGAQPDAHRDGADRRHRLGENRQPVGKNIFANIRHQSNPLA